MSEGVYQFPLSFAQERLWFLDQLVPDNAFYNVHSAVPIRAPLDASRLERALDTIIERHESLRTTFVMVGDEPRQQVVPHLPSRMERIDLSGLDPEERARTADEIVTEEAGTPFDLETGPLLRAKLIENGPSDFVFVLTLHHIVCDGWSMGVLWNELNLAYTALLMGRPPSLPELPIQYSDFSVWQKEWLAGDHVEEQRSFWRETLADLSPLELPTDRPRQPLASYSGAQVPFELPRHTFDAVKNLGRRHGATPHMTMLAAFQVLLARWTGQSDIVVGVPVAGRTRSELELLIGFFVNTLVMRGDLSGDPCFDELLVRTKETATAAYANQDLPFEQLVADLQPERDLSRNPLFQVTFQLFAGGAVAASQLATDPDDAEAPGTGQRGAAVFDLSLNLWETPTGVIGHFEFCRDLFDRSTIERMAGHFGQLLGSITANPSTAISKLNLLGTAERRRLLEEWNETDRALSGPAGFLELFAGCVAAAPDRTALDCGDARITYAELAEQARHVASALRERGAGPERPVVVALERSVDLVVALLGSLMSGAPYIPLDVEHPDAWLALLLDQLGETVVVTSCAHTERFPAGHGNITSVGELEEAGHDSPFVDPGCRPKDLAYIVFTSGSTGVPKGVEVTHGGLLNLCAWHREHYALTPGTRSSQVASPGFDACGWELWPYLLSGGTVAIAPTEVRTDPSALLSWLSEKRIDVAFVPTPVAELLVLEPMPEDLALRLLLTGGDRLRRGPPPGLPFTVYNNYGPTEYTVVTTACPVEPAPEDEAGRPPPIGRPVANTHVYVLDPIGQPVPIGVCGELYVGGAGLAAGYHGRPDLTRERFVPNPLPGKSKERLYRTGDIVRYANDGMIEYVGREDRQVKIRGNRIELGEIEAALRQVPGVVSAAAVVRDAGADTAALVGYVVPDPGANGGESEVELEDRIRNEVRRSLPAVEVPSVIDILGEIPLTTNGKVDHAALERLGAATRRTRERVAPRNEVEEALVELFEDILSGEEVGIFDDFFADLGGHSLTATQVISRIRQIYDLDLPLRGFFERPTAAGLAESIEQALIDEIEALSDEEVALLTAEKDAPA